MNYHSEHIVDNISSSQNDDRNELLFNNSTHTHQPKNNLYVNPKTNL